MDFILLIVSPLRIVIDIRLALHAFLRPSLKLSQLSNCLILDYIKYFYINAKALILLFSLIMPVFAIPSYFHTTHEAPVPVLISLSTNRHLLRKILY